jgi:alkane 1-monooxygenase
MRDLKYLCGYLIPIGAFLSVYQGGYHSFDAILISFVFIPLLELFLTGNQDNFSSEKEETYTEKPIFDWLLYLNVPMVYGVVAFYLQKITTLPISNFEIVGMTLCVGLMISTNGINVAHELGHRAKKQEQLLSKMLLLPALYMHFFIEHNRGHHKNVSTPDDPASARRNQNVYAFWARSVVYGYMNAWKLEAEKLEKANQAFWSLHNEMLVFQVIQAVYLGGIGVFFGWQGVVAAIVAGMIGFLMLETVNYIEHYGLSRQQLPSGKYEPVLPKHSWNSNHEIGRIVLYELTRHSDHHYKSTRKYQVLRHHEQSPQLPFGYPGCMVLSLFPPLWFYVVHPKLDAIGE